VADLLTAVWSVTISCPNARTSFECALELASLPASMSTWLAVTTIAATCGSVGPPAAQAPVAPMAQSVIRTPVMTLIAVSSCLEFPDTAAGAWRAVGHTLDAASVPSVLRARRAGTQDSGQRLATRRHQDPVPLLARQPHREGLGGLADARRILTADQRYRPRRVGHDPGVGDGAARH